MTTKHIIDLEDLIEDAFQQFHRNTVTRQSDYFVSGKKCIAFMEFDIVVFELSIVFICKSHKEQALSGCQIPEFATTIYAAVKVQITGVRVPILLGSNGPYSVNCRIERSIR